MLFCLNALNSTTVSAASQFLRHGICSFIFVFGSTFMHLFFEFCLYFFKTFLRQKSGLKVHLKKRHNFAGAVSFAQYVEKRTQFTCTICGKEFAGDYANVTFHVRSVHKISIKEYQKLFCSAKMKRSQEETECKEENNSNVTFEESSLQVTTQMAPSA